MVPRTQFNPAEIAASLAQMGWRPNAAAGIAANAYRESSGLSTAVGDQGTSVGLFQHHGPRAQALNQFAAAHGRHWSDPSAQLAFLDKEISPQLRAQLNSAPSPAVASAMFTQQYERPANQTVEVPQRAGMAQQIGSFFQRLNPVSTAQAAEPGQKMTFEDAVGDFLNSRNPSAPTNQPMTPPSGGAAGPMTFDEAVNHYLSTLAPPAAAPSMAQSDAITTPQGPQPLPDEAIPPSPGPGGGFTAWANDLEGANQGINPTGAMNQQPIGTVAVDDGGQTIIDPGKGAGWIPFDPQKHVVMKDPSTGLPTAFQRRPQDEEGLLSRLGRFIRGGVVLGERFPLGSSAAPAAPAAPPPEAAPSHWSQTQARDALGRFTKSTQ